MISKPISSHLVAVYGSLRSGLYNHSVIAHANPIGQGWLEGFRMHDLGSYPGVVPSSNPNEKILVEWYQVCDQTLVALDVLEDYYPHSPESSIYLRKIMPSPYGESWIYLYNQALEQAPWVQSGDWKNITNTR